MLATISESRNWKDGTTFPILCIQARREDQKEELQQLKQIEEALTELVGKAYGKKLASTQKGSGQEGIFIIDLSGVLTLLRAAKKSRSTQHLANSWVKNWLEKKIRPEWIAPVSQKKESDEKIYTCRCGMSFKGSGRKRKKAKKQFEKHQKRCAVLKEASRIFNRCDKFLGRKHGGGEKEKSSDQGKTRKATRLKPRKTSKDKNVNRRTKTRRAKRDNHKTKER